MYGEPCPVCWQVGTYPDEDAAFKAVERAKIAHGVWSGVRRHADGTASILFEPDTYQARRDRKDN